MSNDVDIMFLNILNSCPTTNQLVDVINILKYEYVLSDDELELCDKCLADIEVYNGSNLKKILDIDLNIEIYDKLKIDDMIDEFIHERKKREINDIFSLASEDIFSPDSVDKLLNGYTKRIQSSIDQDLFNGNIFFNESEDIYISSISDEVDAFSKGIRKGTITSIIGDSGNFKSLWAINIAYNAVSDGKNVMYLSINTDKEIVAKRLLTRHNCNEKFPNSYSYENMHNIKNATFSTNVIQDFMENYSTNIVVFDDGDLGVPNVRSIKRLIAEAEKYFLSKTDSGIDLIIIDDLTYLSYYNGKQYINARQSVIGKYYKYLKGEASDLLGTNHGCSILCTHQDIDDGLSASKNNGNYKLAFIPQSIVAASDNIFTIYGSPLTCTTKAKVKVVKAPYGEAMDRAESLAVDYSKWFMSNNDLSLHDIKYLNEIQKYKINELESTVRKFKEERDNAELLLNKYRKGEMDTDDNYTGLGIVYIDPNQQFDNKEEESNE